MKKDKIVFDTETTGLLIADSAPLNRQPYIIELYAVRIDKKNRIVDELETTFSVPVKIESHITKLTAIEESDLVGSPQFIDFYHDLWPFFIGVTTLIGHNLSFDVGMLLLELRRIEKQYQFPWAPVHYCTIENSHHIQNKRLKLGELYKMATGNSEIENAHRAKGDTLATLESYKWLLRQKR